MVSVMSLFIKGDEINRLVQRYSALTGITVKSEAIRKALSDAIAAIEARTPLKDKVAAIQARAATEGFVSDQSTRGYTITCKGDSDVP